MAGSGHIYGLAHEVGARLHRGLSSRPLASRAYFQALSIFRVLPARTFKQRILNSIASARWPELDLPFRTVLVGKHTEIRVRPHPGEFDMRALVDRHLDYEGPVFEWLETSVSGYDTIVEIGANVGIYTAFFARYQRSTPAGVMPRIYAFEPSAAAFARLTQNLGANGGEVRALQCAVAETAGMVEFHEPAGHLTNGSLHQSFAALFSGEVTATVVQAMDGPQIAALVGVPGRTLLKIDVEGAEAEVLRTLRPFIAVNRPDILIEVLDLFLADLQSIDFLEPLGYRFYSFESGGRLLQRPGFEPGPESRDMLLAPR